MKDHSPLFVMFIFVVFTMTSIISAKPYNNSVSSNVRMPLVSNELKAPLVADLDVSALNTQLKDYIDDNIVSTFTEKIEDIVNKKLLELKNGMLYEYSSKLEKSHTRYDQRLADMHSEYDKGFSDLSEKQSENVTNFIKNVQEWQNTMMQSMNEQSGYLQKSKIEYENQVSEIEENHRVQTAKISKEVITNFTYLKTDMEEWKDEMVDDLIKEVTINLTQSVTNMIPARECSDIPKLVGVYNVIPDYSPVFQVRCEAGGWTVIQKRFNGVTEFYRNWQDYEDGFGDLNEEFWLGDSMTYHNNMPFSTYDRDNDRSSLNCAAYNETKGAWWYKVCWRSSLNGKYGRNVLKGGIKYYAWESNRKTLKKSSMMIKRT